MLAFMGTQSFIMMYQAGEGWQYGKRKQSAMSNEEFNKQTPLSIMDRQRTELIKALPSIQDSMNAMTPLIRTIVEQYGDFLREVIDATPEALKKATSGGFGLPVAFGSTGVTNQKTFNQGTEIDWIKVLTGLAKSITGMGNFGRVPGPNTNIVESAEQKAYWDALAKNSQNLGGSTFIDIDRLIPPTQIIQKTSKYKLPLQEVTESQKQKTAIVEGGLSPLATAAVNQFKQNIDNIQKNMDATIAQEISNKGRNYNSASARAAHKAYPTTIATLTNKLFKLRQKFRDTYGYYY